MKVHKIPEEVALEIEVMPDAKTEIHRAINWMFTDFTIVTEHWIRDNNELAILFLNPENRSLFEIEK